MTYERLDKDMELEGRTLTHHFFTDANGMPAGGESIIRTTKTSPAHVTWQNGPLVDPETGERMDPTGAFVEDIIRIAIARLEWVNAGQFECHQNHMALHHLGLAIKELNDRTADREARGVEGTHQP